MPEPRRPAAQLDRVVRPIAHSPFGYLGGAVVCLSAAEQDATVALPVATLA